MLFKRCSEKMPAWQGTPKSGLNKRTQALLLFAILAGISILTFSPHRPHLRLPNSSTYTQASSLSSKQSSYAYVTLLAPNPKLDNKNVTDDEDEYFVGTRVLAYQLLHAPNTRTNSSIDFVVLATPDIPKSKLDRLRKDGATVKVVEKIHEKWMKPGLVRWRDMLSKLYMWKLVEYDKTLFLDADMLIAKPMDGIFTDSTTVPLKTKPSLAVADEGPFPSSYVFAAQTYFEGRVHKYPIPSGDFFSGGFFLAQPSIEAFNYYRHLASMEGRFDSNGMEQHMLNYAHRKDGPMPWVEVNYIYTTTWPSMNEYEAGARSMHEKWWDQSLELDPKLRRMWYQARDDMKAFHTARDGAERKEMMKETSLT